MAGEYGATIISSYGSEGSFSHLMTTPFYPIFGEGTEGEGENAEAVVKCEFVKGYVFDYNNSKTLLEPIPIKPKTFTITGGSAVSKVYVQLAMRKTTGELIPDQCKLVEESELESPPNKHPKLPITSNFHANILELTGDKAVVKTDEPVYGSEEDIFKWYIILAEFEKGDVKSLYLRDNIHLNMLKIRQMFNENDPENSSDEVFPVIANMEDQFTEKSPKQHHEGNGVLPFVGLGLAFNKDLLGQNALEIFYDPENGVVRYALDTQNPLLLNQIDTMIGEAIEDHLTEYEHN